MANGSDDGFIFVSRKKSRNYGRKNHKSPVKYNLSAQEECLTNEQVTESLEVFRAEVVESSFWINFKSTCGRAGLVFNQEEFSNDIKPLNAVQIPKRIVCYGLGNYASCLIARYQLALLQLMRHELKISKKHCEVFDPRFSEQEIALIPSLDMTVIPVNEEGKRQVSEPALFFMPHCGRPLYNNLVWANWAPQTLPQLMVLGNSFSFMYERTLDTILQKEAAFILKVLPYTKEYKFSEPFKHDDVFNDIALHLFPHDKLTDAPDALWEGWEEPIYYENVEIILNTDPV